MIRRAVRLSFCDEGILSGKLAAFRFIMLSEFGFDPGGRKGCFARPGGPFGSMAWKGGRSMHSAAYLEARKEFINCLCMSIIGIGVPVVLAFTEWWPVMKAEKRKELEQGK